MILSSLKAYFPADIVGLSFNWFQGESELGLKLLMSSFYCSALFHCGFTALWWHHWDRMGKMLTLTSNINLWEERESCPAHLVIENIPAEAWRSAGFGPLD